MSSNVVACNARFSTKGCDCLTDPMDPYNPICGYVARDNGLVYPCDPGCCQPNCGTKKGKQPRMDIEFRPTFGGALPKGFNVNLATSDAPTSSSLEAPFEPVKPNVPQYATPDQNDPKVKDQFIKLFVALLVILLLSIFIGLKV
jgi:hypothetical protein